MVTATNDGFRDTPHTLRSWLTAWLEGSDLWAEMFETGESVVRINPFKKKPQTFPTLGKPRGNRLRLS